MTIDPAVAADPTSFMRAALVQARAAADAGDVPVGAVVVRDGHIIATAHNRRELDRDPTAHAELLAVRAAARALDDWRLEEATVVVTLEPCPMCAGALWAARVGGVVFGAPDLKAGSTGSLYNLAPTRGSTTPTTCAAACWPSSAVKYSATTSPHAAESRISHRGAFTSSRASGNPPNRSDSG